jgi:hypothetical protein
MMDRQNDVVVEWFENNKHPREPQVLLESIDQLLRLTFEVTRDQLAGLEIIQSLRAVEPLQEVRLNSNRMVAEQFAVVLGAMFNWPVDDALRMQSRLSVDMGYAVVELALEDSSLPSDAVLEQGALMIRLYWRSILAQRAGESSGA